MVKLALCIEFIQNYIVISGFQAKLYPVSFNFALAKLIKSHQKINQLYDLLL